MSMPSRLESSSARPSPLRDRLAQATVQNIRRMQMLCESVNGLVVHVGRHPFGRGGSLDPRASSSWIPVHALLARRQLLGATSPEERAFCQWYARYAYQGLGTIVDLGVWLGSTTLPLAKGMTQRPATAPTTRIQAYDRFVWEQWMSEFVEGANSRLPYHPGDDFRPTFEQQLGPLLATVDVHRADLSQERWAGGPIEFLMIDAMKSWELASNIVGEFLTSVVPNGLIVHQDFAHYFTPWIHLICYRLREHLELYYDIPHSGGAVFRLRRSFGDVDLAALTSPDSYQSTDVSAAFDYSRELARMDKHANITAAEAMFYLYSEDFARAQSILLHARRLGLRGGDLDVVEQRLRDPHPPTSKSLTTPE